MSTDSMTAIEKFIGSTPYDEWMKVVRGTKGSTPFFQPYDPAVRVLLSDGTEHVYPTEWSYTVRDQDAAGQEYLKQDTTGGHQYSLSSNGALHIVEYSSTVHYQPDYEAKSETVSNEAVATTYAPGAWTRVTGPWKREVLAEDSQTRNGVRAVKNR